MGLKPKNKGHTNFYECCDLMEKVYLMYIRRYLLWKCKHIVHSQEHIFYIYIWYIYIRNPFLAILQYFRDQILTSQVEFYLLRPSNWWQMISTWLSWKEIFIDLVINLLEHFLKNPSFRTFWHFFDYIL